MFVPQISFAQLLVLAELSGNSGAVCLTRVPPGIDLSKPWFQIQIFGDEGSAEALPFAPFLPFFGRPHLFSLMSVPVKLIKVHAEPISCEIEHVTTVVMLLLPFFHVILVHIVPWIVISPLGSSSVSFPFQVSR